jgi:superfamily II DNA helicase RecQ
VAHDRTLIEMAKRMPRTHEELRAVFGMGPARIEQYGDGFLEALSRGP